MDECFNSLHLNFLYWFHWYKVLTSHRSSYLLWVQALQAQKEVHQHKMLRLHGNGRDQTRTDCHWTVSLVFFFTRLFFFFFPSSLTFQRAITISTFFRYKKPTDFKRKKLQLLTKKPLYLHLHQTLQKDS